MAAEFKNQAEQELFERFKESSVVDLIKERIHNEMITLNNPINGPIDGVAERYQERFRYVVVAKYGVEIHRATIEAGDYDTSNDKRIYKGAVIPLFDSNGGCFVFDFIKEGFENLGLIRLEEYGEPIESNREVELFAEVMREVIVSMICPEEFVSEVSNITHIFGRHKFPVDVYGFHYQLAAPILEKWY